MLSKVFRRLPAVLQVIFSLSSAVFARIDLQTPEVVLAQAAFDDSAPVANGAEIRFGLDGWPKVQDLFIEGLLLLPFCGTGPPSNPGSARTS